MLAAGEIKGVPSNCQVLHVEQEVVGDDTTVLQSVLDCDTERNELLEEEAELMAKLNLVSGAEVVRTLCSACCSLQIERRIRVGIMQGSLST